MKHAPMPVLVNGTTFRDAKEAAASLGVALSTVYYAISKGDPNTVGRGKGRHNSPRGGLARVEVVIGCYRFPTATQASVALGFKNKHLGRVIVEGSLRQKEVVLRRAMEWFERAYIGDIPEPEVINYPRKAKHVVEITADWVAS